MARGQAEEERGAAVGGQVSAGRGGLPGQADPRWKCCGRGRAEEEQIRGGLTPVAQVMAGIWDCTLSSGKFRAHGTAHSTLQ